MLASVRFLKVCLCAPFYVALVVGTILNLINQGDALLGGTAVSWGKIILTYIVPYAVCTYGAVSSRLQGVRSGSRKRA